MKILHTSDWHLGKSIHGQDLLEDQRYAIRSIEKELENGYDAVLIAGDVYDRAVPPSESIQIFSGFIEKMVEQQITVIVIPGNHDSPSRLDFASGILEKNGIHFRCRYERITEPVIVTDDEGNKVQVFALPFVDEVLVKELYPDEGIRTHQEATGFLLDRIREARDDSLPSILMAHAYTGREPLRSDSERELLVGNQGLVDIDVFRGFDHVALGHLHRPQVSSRTHNVHYSGSLMTYSFSETGHLKSSIVLELSNGRLESSEFEHVPLRKFSKVSGNLGDLLDSPDLEIYRSHYLSVILTDTGYLIDTHRKLREKYPYLLEIDQPALHRELDKMCTITREQADDPRQLFSLFLDRFQWEDGEERDTAIELFEEVRKEFEDNGKEVS